MRILTQLNYEAYSFSADNLLTDFLATNVEQDVCGRDCKQDSVHLDHAGVAHEVEALFEHTQ